jgi:hypothetical protein
MAISNSIKEPLRPLPELPVLRDSYCSKETVDRVVRWIHDHHPEWLIEVLAEEVGSRAGHYIAVRNLLGHLKREAGREIEGLTPYLGEIDLLYEISRRLRSAYGLSDILPRGKPLAPSPNGPFPPMLVLKVSDHNERHGATQEMVDTVLADFYDQRPDLWFAAGEAAQRRLGFLIAGGPREMIVRKIILKRGFATDERTSTRPGGLSSISSASQREFQRRVRAMTETPVEEPFS